MANAKTTSKSGTGSISKKVTIAEMRGQLNKTIDSYNELVAVHSCKTKRLESIEAAAMLIGRTVEQNPFLANGFYEPLVKMIIGLPHKEITPATVTENVKELKTVYSLNKAQQARWMQAQVDIDGKPIYSEDEIASIGKNKDLEPEKSTAAFYVLKEALLDANYESLEECVAFSGTKYASMFTLFMQSPSKYIDIINEHGVNMCLDVLEHNMINNTNVDYVPISGSLINQPLDVNAETFPETQPMVKDTQMPVYNIGKAQGVFIVPDLVIPLEERMIESVLDTQGAEVIVSGYPGIGLTNLQACCELPINNNESETMNTDPNQQTPQNHEMEIDLSDLSSLKPNTIYMVTDGKIEMRGNNMFHDTKESLDKLAAASDEKTLIDNTRKQATDVAMKEFMTTVQAIDDKNAAKLENKPAIKGTDKHKQSIKDYLETEGMIAERFCQLNDNPFNFFVCSVLESTLTVLQEHRIKYMMNEAGEFKGMIQQPSELETLAKATTERCKANAEAAMKDTKEEIDNYRKKTPENQQDKAALLASELTPEEISLLKQIKTSIKSLLNTHGMSNYSRDVETKLGGVSVGGSGRIHGSQFDELLKSARFIIPIRRPIGSDPKSHLFISIFADKKKGKKADKKKGKKKNK